MDSIKIKHFIDKCDIFYDSNYYENYELSEISSKFYNYYNIFFSDKWIYSNFIKLYNTENKLISNDKSMYIICINCEYNKYHFHLENNIKNFVKTHTYKYILHLCTFKTPILNKSLTYWRQRYKNLVIS